MKKIFGTVIYDKKPVTENFTAEEAKTLLNAIDENVINASGNEKLSRFLKRLSRLVEE